MLKSKNWTHNALGATLLKRIATKEKFKHDKEKAGG